MDIPIVFAFSAGFAAAFNPCGAAMFPAYVGYQLGTLNTGIHPVKSGLMGVRLGLAVTAGFLVVFGFVGVVLATGGTLVGQFLPFIGLGIGVTITLMGVWLLLSRRTISIAGVSRVNLGSGKGTKNVFLFGIAYATASLSCALPLFLVAIGVVAGHRLNASNVGETVVGALVYGLGMGVVMIFSTLGVVFFKGLIYRWIRFLMLYVEPVGKLAMVGAGFYLVYYWVWGDGSDLLVLRAAELF